MGRANRDKVHKPQSPTERWVDYAARHPWQARLVYSSPLILAAGLYLTRMLLWGEHSAPAGGLEYHVYFTQNPTDPSTLCTNFDLASNPIPDSGMAVTPLTNGEASGLETHIGGYVSALGNKDPVAESEHSNWLFGLIYDVIVRSGLPPDTQVKLGCTAFDNVSLEQAHVVFQPHRAG